MSRRSYVRCLRKIVASSLFLTVGFTTAGEARIAVASTIRATPSCQGSNLVGVLASENSGAGNSLTELRTRIFTRRCSLLE